MKILFLSPQPFYQERGTPIAVKLAVEGLARNSKNIITLVTYHEGESVPLQNVKHLRIWAPSWLTGIRPGISIKKIICDLFFTFFTIRHLFRSRKDQYDLIHAVEESVFIALFAKFIFGIPYIYDMDSSLTSQLTEKWWGLKPFHPLLNFIEGFAIKNATKVIAVCDALSDAAKEKGAREVHIVYDISLLDLYPNEVQSKESIRESCGLSESDKILLYIGNFEPYQGIDLLIESFQHVKDPSAHLILIGGALTHQAFYKNKAKKLNVGDRVHCIGSRPVAALQHYLKQADILVSPRVRGNNTPMKVYSYLHSGVPVLLTNLPTHTQVIDESFAIFAEPNPVSFGEAMNVLLNSPEDRAAIAERAKIFADKNFSFDAFVQKFSSAYENIKFPN